MFVTISETTAMLVGHSSMVGSIGSVALGIQNFNKGSADYQTAANTADEFEAKQLSLRGSTRLVIANICFLAGVAINIGQKTLLGAEQGATVSYLAGQVQVASQTGITWLRERDRLPKKFDQLPEQALSVIISLGVAAALARYGLIQNWKDVAVLGGLSGLTIGLSEPDKQGKKWWRWSLTGGVAGIAAGSFGNLIDSKSLSDLTIPLVFFGLNLKCTLYEAIHLMKCYEKTKPLAGKIENGIVQTQESIRKKIQKTV